METIQISMEVLAGLLGTTSGSIADALKSDGDNAKPQTEVDSWVKSALGEKFKTLRTEAHNEGHGRGTKEALSAKEKELREKGFKGATIDEMLAEASKVEPGKELTDEVIKGSEIFKKAVEKLEQKVQEKAKEVETLVQRQNEEKLNSYLTSLVEQTLKDEKSNFVLPEDQTVAQNQIRLFVDQLKKNPWHMKDGKYQPLAPNGEDPLKDDLYNVIGAESYISSEAAKMFVRAKSQQRSTADMNGKRPGEQKDEGGFTIPEFKNKQEAFEHIGKITDLKELEAVKVHIQGLVDSGKLA